MVFRGRWSILFQGIGISSSWLQAHAKAQDKPPIWTPFDSFNHLAHFYEERVMAVQENGIPIENVKDRPNGQPTGHVSRRSKKPPRSWSGFLFSNAARYVLPPMLIDSTDSSRLTIWYALYMTIFRCPSDPNRLSESSPQVCKPYLNAKSYAQPYVQPYYETYAEPYLEKARPYYDQLNTRVVSPVTTVTTRNYAKYAAPRVDAARSYSQQQWEKAVLPQLLLAQQRASQLYDMNLAPHVSKVSEAASPYYSSAKDTAEGVHKNHILPAVDYSKPLVANAYDTSQDFIFNTAYPTVRGGWTKTIIFVDGTLWPFLKGLYSDNVRPQLVMISERISKYQESRKLQAVMDEAEPSTDATSTISTASAPTETATDTGIEDLFSWDDESSSASATPRPSASKQPKREPEWATEESIKEDLEKWQKKFGVAADKGTDDLREHVAEVVFGLVSSDIDGVGRRLANALEKTSELEIQNVKSKIKDVVASVEDDASADDTKQAEDEVVKAIRASGLEIKERAKKVREWAQKFEKEVNQRTATASASTLEVLDGIRDLGLQEIGMRWAWMEGVTYKHWAKYHELKKKFDSWRHQVKSVATEHPAANDAKATARQILEESMALTEDVAKELIKLREVAKWKIRARDATDDFEPRAMPAAAISAASSLVSEIQATGSSIAGETQGTAESMASEVSDAINNARSSPSSVVAGTHTGSLESAASHASMSAEDMASGASPVVAGTSTGSIESAMSHASSETGSAESILSDASSVADEGASSASSVILGTTGTIEKVMSASSGAAEDASSSAGSVVDSLTSSSADPLYTSAASSKVWGGAMAQEVKGQIPILDDVFDNSEESAYSEKMQSIVNEAGDRYADVTSAVSEAIFGTQQNTAESMTSVAQEQYSSALAAASKALYGEPQGTPTAAVESLAQQASSMYSEALKVAGGHYEDAKSIASQQVSGTPKPVHEQMFSSIESAYAGAQVAASSRLDAALKAASAVSKSTIPTQGPLESISSVASVRLQEALSIASAEYSSVKTAVGATPTAAYQPYYKQAQRSYYEAIGFAHEQYSDFLGAASRAVAPTPTPEPAYKSLLNAASSSFAQATEAAASLLESSSSSGGSVVDSIQAQYDAAISAASSSLSEASYSASTALYGAPSGSFESVSSVASQNWADLVSKASEQVYGTSRYFYEDYASQAGDYSAQVTDYAGSQYSAVEAYVAELINGKEPDFTESVRSRLQSAYYTGLADIPSAASSYASEAYDSASSVVSTLFTTPPEISNILEAVTEQLNAAVHAASVQARGTPAGYVDQASSAMADSYSSASSVASEALFRTQAGYAEQASLSIADAMSNAQKSVSVAICGSSTGSIESATSAVGDTMASASSIVAENAAAAGSAVDAAVSQASSMGETVRAKVSEGLFGPEQGAMESAQGRIAEAVESARSAIAAMASDAVDAGSNVVGSISSSVDEAASAMSSTVSSATKYLKDEL